MPLVWDKMRKFDLTKIAVITVPMQPSRILTLYIYILGLLFSAVSSERLHISSQLQVFIC